MTRSERETILSRFKALEAAAKRTPQGPNYGEIVETVAADTGHSTREVSQVVLDDTILLGAG